jgi:glycosyl transferase, family 25
MSHVLEYFERIWIINLASRPDRRREMALQLQRIGLSIESASIQLFPAVRPADRGGFPSLGARGCFMSHLNVLREAASQGLQRILILEDDLNFAEDFSIRAVGLLEDLAARPWSVFYGGYHLGPGVRFAGQGCVAVTPDVALETSHFMAFQGQAIHEAAAYLGAMLERKPGDPLGGPMHVDGAYNWFRRAHPHYVAMAAVPELGYQRASRTDIHALRWFDRWPGIRAAVAVSRRIRNA